MDRSVRSTASHDERRADGSTPRAPTPAADGQMTLLRDADRADDRLARLARAIEGEVIPRLMLAHRTAQHCVEVPPPVGVPLADGDVVAFTDVVLAADDEDALAFVQETLARGVAVETVFLDLLAPTARRLGELWTADKVPFTDVTLGLGRLQRVLRDVSAGFNPQGAVADVGEPAEGERRILLLPSPGEQHTFGLVMVSELFRRAGWDVAGGPWETGDDAPALVGNDWYDAIGFSLAAEMHTEALADCIAAVRQSSRNGHIGVVVGGPLLRDRPDLATRLGADLVTADGRQAPALVAAFLARQRSQT